MEETERTTINEQHKKQETQDKQTNQQHGQLIWSWGAGTDGQLGTGKLEDEHSPQLLNNLSNSLSSFPPIYHLSCGGAHVIALTSGGKVMTWGRGSSGQLGHGDIVPNCLYPKLVDFLASFNISHVSAGWNHSGFVSDSGCLFTCGDGSFGQLGHGDYQSYSSPKEVSFFSSKHVAQIACGMRHSLALLKGNIGDQVYGYGSGKRGQLGVSKDKIKSLSLPQLCSGFDGVEVASIIANGDHSAALSAGGQLYTWGRGFSRTSDVYVPQSLPSSLCFKQAALGWNHALVLTGEDEVIMLGGSHHGVLGEPQRITHHPNSSDFELNRELLYATAFKMFHPMIQEEFLVPQLPSVQGTVLSFHSSHNDFMSRVVTARDSGETNLSKVPGLDGKKVMLIAAGAEHSAIVTDDEQMWTWGWGEHGQLGMGNTDDQTVPQLVDLGNKSENNHWTSRAYCGSGFTFALKTQSALSD